MILYTYDGSFDGLLTVVFEVYRRGEMPVDIVPAQMGCSHLLAETIHIATSEVAARRVARGLARGGAVQVGDLRDALRSRAPGIERTLLYRAIRPFGVPRGVDPAQADALRRRAAQAADVVERLARQVRREVHRMHAFVRFETTTDGLYVADVEPQFDVVDLLAEHFTARYPAQRWLIRDVARGKALAYDGQTARVVRTPHTPAHRVAEAVPAEREAQALWQAYFSATTIPARRNLPLQRRHVPLRYRKYLPEMRSPEESWGEGNGDRGRGKG